MFKLNAPYKPTGDQPEAIAKLTAGLQANAKYQTLLGVTGSGKTFSIANVIQKVNRPTLVISHNKTLAAQLYQEFKEFFPKNAVEYFVSYYDYYQPESYIPQTDTYIEKDADINQEIDRLRLSATTSLMSRRDVIIVSSVSCIYNLGSPAEYSKAAIELRENMKLRKVDLFKRLTQLYYDRDELDFKRGTYRVRGDIVDVFPAYLEFCVRLEFFDDTLLKISFFDPLNATPIDYQQLPNIRRGSHTKTLSQDVAAYVKDQSQSGGFVEIFPAKHYVAAEERRAKALTQIELDLAERVKAFEAEGKMIEAYRLKQKTMYDLEMIQEVGYCKGIENYSRYFDGREPGQTPYSLLDFFPKDFLMVIDESHITVPQIRGMYNGDLARKKNLVDFGFRLPSAFDNRPLNFTEFESKINQVIFTSATPADFEREHSKDFIVEQLVRPTGILDPLVQILPTLGQIDDLVVRIEERVANKERVLVTTLTKRMAEELSTYLIEKGIKVTYLHSDVQTLERTNILDDLRRGNYDVLVGINLLREGLDLPEVSLVAILDADKEGFLRSSSALVQIMGRAARHIKGYVVMYADRLTDSMKHALGEVSRRRAYQLAYNQTHNITPVSISKPVRDKLIDEVIEETLTKKGRRRSKGVEAKDYAQLPPDVLKKELRLLEEHMKFAAQNLDFEQAAGFRDEIRKIKKFLE